MAFDRLIAARAEALFASDLSARCHPSEAAVAAAIRNAIRAHGGIRGCAGMVAAAYGEYPELAAARMRWARQLIEVIYSPAASGGGSEMTGRPVSEISRLWFESRLRAVDAARTKSRRY
jgi:hypothetical protein